MTHPAVPIPQADIDVVLRGPVPDRMREYASETVAHVTRLTGREVRHLRIVLDQRRNPAMGERSRAELSMTISGAPVRARASGTTPMEALDRVIERAERLVVDVVNRRNDRSRWLSADHGSRWQRRASAQPPRAGGVTGAGEIVRRKTFALTPTTVDEAVYDMDVLEHDFYLFTDVGSGRPAVVFRDGDGFGVTGLAPDTTLPPRVHATPPPPALDEAAAIGRIDAGGEPFVFYIDAETGQGHVMYRRHDGTYGLITSG